MSSEKEKKVNSNLTRIIVLIPIAISVLSLFFGGYQYFDKRDLEKEKNKLEIELIKKKNQADITINYLETDLTSICEWVEHGVDIDEAFLKWLSYLERILPFNVKLGMLENFIYKKIKEHVKNIEPDDWGKVNGDIQDQYISFFLIRNEGGSKATNIYTRFYEYIISGESEYFPIKIGQLDPGAGVMFCIDYFNKETGEHYAPVLEQSSKLEYFDVFLKKKQEMFIRSKNDSPRIISPKIRLAK